MDLNLQGKVALVIASSQGLGKAIATELVLEGANVMITSIDGPMLKIVQEELQALGKGKVAQYEADITKAEDIRSLVQFTRDTFGKIDILVNNAGGPPGGSFDNFKDEDWQKAYELNLLSYIRIIREVLPDLKVSGGRIVNMTSSSVRQPIPNLILSNTFRMGVLGLSKSLAEELAPFNILVHTVAPGRIATDRVAFLDKLKAEKMGITPEEVAAQSRKTIPLGRYGEPEELAKVVAFLVSGACTYMTGSVIQIDGGMIKSV
ncbi:MAG: SDR family oxidoreductase [Peptococcaceae bacterium]|nr:SDR family oxidoreductase [Peptococcaceae bacterium]